MGDPQRDRVYRAEEDSPPGAQLHAADQVRRYVAFVTGSDWWNAAGLPAVEVRIGRTANAWGGRLPSGAWYIGLPGWASVALEDDARRAVFAGRPVDWPWAWSERTICHELAHVATMAANETASGHGSWFCTRYLAVTEAVRGPLARWAFERAFQRHRVAYSEPEDHWDDALGPDALDAALWRPYRPTRPARRHEIAQGVLVP